MRLMDTGRLRVREDASFALHGSIVRAINYS
jgi:hypothetical protein